MVKDDEYMYEINRLEGERDTLLSRLSYIEREAADEIERLNKRVQQLECEVEQLRAKLADLPRNADGDVVLPPCKMWKVRRLERAKPLVSPLVSQCEIDAIERWGDHPVWKAREYGDRQSRASLSDLYSTEASAKRAAEVKP